MTERLTDPSFLLMVTANPELEEDLVDWLLSCGNEHGFSSFPVNGHSSQHDGLSLAEQVSGRKQQVRFQLHLEDDDLYRVLNRLRKDFEGSGVHYWVLPVVESGRI